MKPLLPHVSSIILCDVFSTASRPQVLVSERLFVKQVDNAWKCHQCRQTRGVSRIGIPSWRRHAGEAPTRRNAAIYQLVESLRPSSRHASSTSPPNPTTNRSKDEPVSTRTDLPSQEEGRRSQVAKRFSHLMDNVQSNIFIAGQRLNDLTGYSGIEALKKEIEEQGQNLPISNNKNC